MTTRVGLNLDHPKSFSFTFVSRRTDCITIGTKLTIASGSWRFCASED